MSPKQKRFCEEYLIDLNATQAAIRAGYSKKTAYSIGEENLKKPEIKEFIESKRKELSEKTGVTAQMVINELAKIGFANIQDYIEAGNEVVDFSTIDKSKAAAIGSIKTEQVVGDTYNIFRTEFKMLNKLDALEKLGRHLGVFEKDNQQKQVDIRQWVYAAASELKKSKIEKQ